MKEEIAQNHFRTGDLQILVFDEADIHSKNPPYEQVEDHEILYKGQMFDVIRVEIKSGKQRIYCITDKAESRLILRFKKFMDESGQRSQSGSNLQSLKFSFGFFNIPPPTSMKDWLSGYETYLPAFRFIHYPDTIIQILAPPPRMA